MLVPTPAVGAVGVPVSAVLVNFVRSDVLSTLPRPIDAFVAVVALANTNAVVAT